jgi:hypothetical protein
MFSVEYIVGNFANCFSVGLFHIVFSPLVSIAIKVSVLTIASGDRRLYRYLVAALFGIPEDHVAKAISVDEAGLAIVLLTLALHPVIRFTHGHSPFDYMKASRFRS